MKVFSLYINTKRINKKISSKYKIYLIEESFIKKITSLLIKNKVNNPIEINRKTLNIFNNNIIYNTA